MFEIDFMFKTIATSKVLINIYFAKKGIRETYCDVCKHIVAVLMYVIHDGTEAILEL